MNRLDNGNRKFIFAQTMKEIFRRYLLSGSNVINGYDAKTKTRSLLFDRKLSLSDLSNGNHIKEFEKTKKNKPNTFIVLKAGLAMLKLFGVNDKHNKIDGLGGNLKYFKTAQSPAESTDRNKENLTKQSIEMLCFKKYL